VDLQASVRHVIISFNLNTASVLRSFPIAIFHLYIVLDICRLFDEAIRNGKVIASQYAPLVGRAYARQQYFMKDFTSTATPRCLDAGYCPMPAKILLPLRVFSVSMLQP
jgi:hypothetical protein